MEYLTLIKIVSIPVLLLAVHLLSKRYGPYIAGMLAGLPVVSGPVSLMITLEQGKDFGIVMARGILPGICAAVLYCIAYSWAARRFKWYFALPLALGEYFISALLLSRFPDEPVSASLIAFASVLLGSRFLPTVSEKSSCQPEDKGIPWLQMFSGVIIMIVETGLASIMGARSAGFLVFFPVLSILLGLFTHAEKGADTLVPLYEGIIGGTMAAAVFACFVAFCLPVFSTAFTYSAATIISLLSSFIFARVRGQK